MTTLTVFKSTIPSVNYIFSNGKSAMFINNVFRTDIPSEVSALEYEVAQHHPHIYIDAAERTIESEMIDPMNALRAKVIAEYLKSQEAAMLISNDRGNTLQIPVKAANTLDVAPAAAGGSGAQVLANVMATVKKI